MDHRGNQNHGPAQYEVQEVVASETDNNTNITTSVEIQCRIRDDGSKSRPFVRVKTDYGGRRTVYCNPAEADVVHGQLGALLEKAKVKAKELDAQNPRRR